MRALKIAGCWLLGLLAAAVFAVDLKPEADIYNRVSAVIVQKREIKSRFSSVIADFNSVIADCNAIASESKKIRVDTAALVKESGMPEDKSAMVTNAVEGFADPNIIEEQERMVDLLRAILECVRPTFEQ